jgi:hypothetical protein
MRAAFDVVTEDVALEFVVEVACAIVVGAELVETERVGSDGSGAVGVNGVEGGSTPTSGWFGRIALSGVK